MEPASFRLPRIDGFLISLTKAKHYLNTLGKSELKAFDHILVQRGWQYPSLTVLVNPDKWVEKHEAREATKLSQVLNALLKLWCSQNPLIAMIRSRNTGYDVGNTKQESMFMLNKNTIEAWAIYMNPFRQRCLEKAKSYSEVLCFDGTLENM